MSKPDLIDSIESDNYVARLFNDNGDVYISIKSKKGWGYSAIHRHYTMISEKGVHSQKRITREIGSTLLSNILKKGDTEGFCLYESEDDFYDVSADALKTVIHKLTKEEKQYTSRGEKLLHHWPIFKKYRDTGYGSIIRGTMTLHQLCSSHCQYCSTIARNKKDSISLSEAKDFVEKLYFGQAEYNKNKFPEYNDLYFSVSGTDIRLKGLILSGGGQPNLWPHFTEFVEWLSSLDIELGLITNGFPRNVDEQIYKKFAWIRLSITPEDASPHYKNGKFDQQYIPETIKHNNDLTFGLSYVYGPWTDDDILCRIRKSIDDWGVEYCRLLTDCNLSRNAQIREHASLSKRLKDLDLINSRGEPLAKIFHQLKYHGTQEEADGLWRDGQCYLQSYNVFWDTTGHEESGHSFCYPCDSITVLSESSTSRLKTSERRFNSDIWGTVTNDRVEHLFTQPIKPFFDPRKECSSCLFMRNNQTVKDLLSLQDYSLVVKDDDLAHINFP